MKRAQLTTEEETDDGIYFKSTKPTTFSSGCGLLDCSLGGGWALGRVANIVGDKSTGKTLLAIEACANFHRKYPEAPIHYIEAEAAFDEGYAAQLGLPVDFIIFPTDITTVEDLFEYASKMVEKIGAGPGLLIVDSLDALSDRAEVGRDIGEGTYGAAKPKLLSQLFRRLVQKIKAAQVAVIIISQVRDNIGVAFGEKHTRSGGKALDFYSSQILWLSQIKRITKTRKGVDRVIGVEIRALCKKNKLGPPFREAEFPILFGYGVEDVEAAVKWLDKAGIEAFDSEKAQTKFLRSLPTLGAAEYRKERKRLNKLVRAGWVEIEKDFAPNRRKYA